MLTPEQIAAGWIPHDGGPPPDARRAIHVKLRNGGIGWVSPLNDRWKHSDSRSHPHDIIAYLPEPKP